MSLCRQQLSSKAMMLQVCCARSQSFSLCCGLEPLVSLVWLQHFGGILKLQYCYIHTIMIIVSYINIIFIIMHLNVSSCSHRTHHMHCHQAANERKKNKLANTSSKIFGSEMKNTKNSPRSNFEAKMCQKKF